MHPLGQLLLVHMSHQFVWAVPLLAPLSPVSDYCSWARVFVQDKSGSQWLAAQSLARGFHL